MEPKKQLTELEKKFIEVFKEGKQWQQKYDQFLAEMKQWSEETGVPVSIRGPSSQREFYYPMSSDKFKDIDMDQEAFYALDGWYAAMEYQDPGEWWYNSTCW